MLSLFVIIIYSILKCHLLSPSSVFSVGFSNLLGNPELCFILAISTRMLFCSSYRRSKMQYIMCWNFILQAELLRDNCRPELLQAQTTLQDFELRFAEKSSYSSELENGKSSRTQMHQAINVLFPQVYQILIDCVRGNNLMLRSAGEEKRLGSWYTRHLKFLFDLPWSSTRRVLAQTSGEAPAPSPTSPSPSPAPSIHLRPTNIPASPPVVPFLDPDVNSNVRPTASDQTSGGASGEQSSNQKSSNRTVVIAVVVTASVTLVIVAVFFLFCRRCCGIGPGRGKNDERPLLSLSMSDYSIGTKFSCLFC